MADRRQEQLWEAQNRRLDALRLITLTSIEYEFKRWVRWLPFGRLVRRVERH